MFIHASGSSFLILVFGFRIRIGKKYMYKRRNILGFQICTVTEMRTWLQLYKYSEIEVIETDMSRDIESLEVKKQRYREFRSEEEKFRMLRASVKHRS